MELPYSVTAAEAIADTDQVILDVRSEREWREGHAKGAARFELSKLQAGELPDIAKDAHLFLYCGSGARSELAKVILETNGWTHVRNMGGLRDWQAAGGAVER